MMTVRKAEERHHDLFRKQEVWFTFDHDGTADPFAGGFGTVEILNETRVPPGAVVARSGPHDAEIITYVRGGGLAYEDSLGRSGLVHAGEFQRLSSRRDLRHSETNISRRDWAHLFQIWFPASAPPLEPSREQKRFSAAERRGLLCAVASPDARRGSLRLDQDAVIYSSLLQAGQHLVYELSEGRCAWVHLVQGEVTLCGVLLTTGDGAGMTAERAVSLTARRETELLLFDLGQRPAQIQNGGVS